MAQVHPFWILGSQTDVNLSNLNCQLKLNLSTRIKNRGFFIQLFRVKTRKQTHQVHFFLNCLALVTKNKQKTPHDLDSIFWFQTH
jgi:hypothetical protein